MNNTITLIIQARVGSKRLDHKSLKMLGKYSLIEWVVLRLLRFFHASQIIIAVPDSEENNILADYGEKFGLGVFRGNENDVLTRFIDASKSLTPQDYVIRVCADNPFISGELLREMTSYCIRHDLDFVHTLSQPPEYPYIDGMGAEIFKKHVLNLIDNSTWEQELREHVTLAAYLGKISVKPIAMPTPKKYTHNHMKIDIDTEIDYTKIVSVIEKNALTPFSSDLEIIESFKVQDW